MLLLVAAALMLAGGWPAERRERLAWLLIGAGVLAWSLGEI